MKWIKNMRKRKHRSTLPEIVSLRLPKEITGRADKLIPKIQGDAEHSAIGRISISSILRLAIIRGLNVVEKEFQDQ